MGVRVGTRRLPSVVRVGADDGIEPAALAARRDKERASLAALRPTIDEVRTLADMHRWLFGRHEAYRGIRPEPVEGLALGTY